MIRTTQIQSDAAIIDLGNGQPSPELLPAELLWHGAKNRFADPDKSWLQYGPEEGDGHFRLALASFLSEAYGVPVPAHELFVTAGASQGLYLVSSLVSRPGDTILVEEPSYFLALRMFADQGLNIEGVPVDEQGLIVDALEEKLRGRRSGPKPAFLYTIPTFQNPSGRTLSGDRRARLVALSQEYELLVLADEVYHLLHFAEKPPPPMRSYPGGRIVSFGSFSKILAPGLRLGWLQADAGLLKMLSEAGLVKSGGGLNPFASAMVRSLLESGAQAQNIEHLRQTYMARSKSFQAALRSLLDESASFLEARGGYFLWLHLPGLDLSEILTDARRAGVSYHPGGLFGAGQSLNEYARLCFAHYETTLLVEAAERLAATIVRHARTS
jgi:DNA-binding transcriptional MocR family regulator